MQEDRRDAAEADEDGGGGDEEYEEIKTLRKAVGSDGKGRDNVATYEDKKRGQPKTAGEGKIIKKVR